MKQIILALLLIPCALRAQSGQLLGIAGTIDKHPNIGLSFLGFSETSSKDFGIGLGINAGITLIETPSVDAKETGVPASAPLFAVALQNAFTFGAMPIVSYKDVFIGVGLSYYRYKIHWYRLDLSSGTAYHSSNDDRIIQDIEPIGRFGYRFGDAAIALSYSKFQRTSMEIYLSLK